MAFPVDVRSRVGVGAMVMDPPPSPSMKNRPKFRGEASVAESTSINSAKAVLVTSGSGSRAKD